MWTPNNAKLIKNGSMSSMQWQTTMQDKDDDKDKTETANHIPVGSLIDNNTPKASLRDLFVPT